VDQTSNIKVVARDALFLFFALTSIGGVVVVIAGGNSANLMLARVAAVTSIVLFGIVGFCISGYLTPRRRWIHLLRVTACVWVLILAFFALIDLPTGERTGAWFLSAVYLLVVMGIGGAISFALRKDPGDTPMRAASAKPSTRTPRAGTSGGEGVKWLKVGAVLSSNLFLVTSCAGIMGASISAAKHFGGKYMARGEAPDSRMIVLASIPDAAVPGRRKLESVTLRGLPEFQSANPDYTFVIPAGEGRIDGGVLPTSYRATALGADGVLVETDTPYDDIFGLRVVGSYEATEREVRPIYTNSNTWFGNFAVGVAGAYILRMIGSILQWVERRRQQRDEPSE